MSKTKRLPVPGTEAAFTLVELLVALIVSSIVLGAVATLAYALNAANDSTGQASRVQSHVRYATLRLSELVRHCRLVCFVGENEFAIWRADDNSDRRINGSELLYVAKAADGSNLRLCEFTTGADDPVVPLAEIQALSTNWWTAYSLTPNYTTLVDECTAVQFAYDQLPARTQLLSISFDVAEDGIARRYQITAALRGRAENLLNQTGDALVSDDD